MTKIILSVLLCLYVTSSFAQSEEENGKIYIKHPSIDVINKSMKAYESHDMTSLAAVYADTAKVWVSGMDKPIPYKEVLKDWATDKDYYDSIKVATLGYPDYLHYKDHDQKFVQSWWVWTGKSKKTGETVHVDFVQFDKFDNAGKVVMEALYGDFSKIQKK
jgi:hypothetical protein